MAVEYRGLTVYELPPPTQGLAALAMLARLRRFERRALEPGLEFVTAFKQARDESYALRNQFISDPDFSSAPLEPFLDPGTRSPTLADTPTTAGTRFTCAPRTSTATSSR